MLIWHDNVRVRWKKYVFVWFLDIKMLLRLGELLTPADYCTMNEWVRCELERDEWFVLMCSLSLLLLLLHTKHSRRRSWVHDAGGGSAAACLPVYLPCLRSLVVVAVPPPVTRQQDTAHTTSQWGEVQMYETTNCVMSLCLCACVWYIGKERERERDSKQQTHNS